MARKRYTYAEVSKMSLTDIATLVQDKPEREALSILRSMNRAAIDVANKRIKRINTALKQLGVKEDYLTPYHLKTKTESGRAITRGEYLANLVELQSFLTDPSSDLSEYQRIIKAARNFVKNTEKARKEREKRRKAREEAGEDEGTQQGKGSFGTDIEDFIDAGFRYVREHYGNIEPSEVTKNTLIGIYREHPFDTMEELLERVRRLYDGTAEQEYEYTRAADLQEQPEYFTRTPKKRVFF